MRYDIGSLRVCFFGELGCTVLFAVTQDDIFLTIAISIIFLQTFSVKFKAAWAKDGYCSYLEQQDNEVRLDF